MKIAFGMIVFNGDHVLQECLAAVYSVADQILIAEGPVKYWQEQGFKTSTDDTNRILHSFPDPEDKIQIVHGQFSEKNEQCNAYMRFLRDDIDYLWNLDSDEVYKTPELEKVIEWLGKNQPTSVGIRSCSFYGGFDFFIGGFELKTDNFLRIAKVYPGAKWLSHRPPTVALPPGVKRKHITSDQLWKELRVQMYHYSYVFPNQVYDKIKYYKAKVSGNNCIDDYFNKVWLPWVLSESDAERQAVEKLYAGVHEFKPQVRGKAFTEPFTGEHPAVIRNSMGFLEGKFERQLKRYV